MLIKAARKDTGVRDPGACRVSEVTAVSGENKVIQTHFRVGFHLIGTDRFIELWLYQNK